MTGPAAPRTVVDVQKADAARFLEWCAARVGAWYLFGGCGRRMWTPAGVVDAPYEGWDCIHLITDGLFQAGGTDLRWTHNTDTLWADVLNFPPVATPKPGDVALWAPRNPRDQYDVEHVELVVGPTKGRPGHYRTFGAAGGGRSTVTLAEAQRLGARVRYRESHLDRPYFAGFRRLPLTHGA